MAPYVLHWTDTIASYFCASLAATARFTPKSVPQSAHPRFLVRLELFAEASECDYILVAGWQGQVYGTLAITTALVQFHWVHFFSHRGLATCKNTILSGWARAGVRGEIRVCEDRANGFVNTSLNTVVGVTTKHNHVAEC